LAKITLIVTLTLFLVSFSLVAQETDEAEEPDTTLSVDKLWELSRLGSPVVSPDGEFIVATVTEYDVEKDKGSTQLFLFSDDGSVQRAITAKGIKVSEPVFSPDSNTLAFVSSREGDEKGQIYLLPMNSPGEATRLTKVPTGVKGLKWVGDHIYFISSVYPEKTWDDMKTKVEEEKDNKVSAWQWNALPYSFFDHWIDEERQAHVFRIPSNGGDIEPLTEPLGFELMRSSQNAGSYAVSPDESLLVFSSNGWDDQVHPNMDLFIADLNAKTVKNLTEGNDAPDFLPVFNHKGDKLAFLSRSIKGFYADTAKINVYDVDNKKVNTLDLDIDRSVTNLIWADNDVDFISSIDDGATRRLYMIGGRSGRTRALTSETNFLAPQLLGRNTVIATNQSFLYPARLVSVNLRNGNVERLDSLNDKQLENVELGTYESVTYQGADGTDIQMWVHYPPGFDKNKKYPLFMLIHGGPHNAISDGFHYRWNAQTFASWGYVVAWPNFHGSSGFGQAFADAINPDWKTKPLKDVQEATKWFEAKPWIDNDRMVAGGASYGGYLSSIVLGTENPYKALLIHAAVYNMYSQTAADFAVHAERFGPYWENPDIYKDISPHYFADKFATPTLVIHGQLDYRVPVGQGFELFRTLQSKDIESRLLYFPDENHWILKPNNSIYWYNQVEEWMGSFVETGGH